MSSLEELRASVRASLPEIEEIHDETLRSQVVEAHALALSETEFERIEDIPEPEEGPGASPLRFGSQADHYRAVTCMAMGIADALESVLGPLNIDRDILIAGALCHDVGKAFEFSSQNQTRWSGDPAQAGHPAIRHPVYGVHLGLVVGLPEPVIHCIGGHSLNGEGALIDASLETTIVKYCDHSFWKILERAWIRQNAGSNTK
jgi:23S rRNA maturation-related 3'-5' exoribonuclease YhaM